MNALQDIIKNQIARFGPISIAEYMTLCLLHPEHGYYTTREPLGATGDFTTAPEISQMFGELLGLCLAQSWIDQGQPAPFALVELGPGKGTLMADILRVTKGVPGFHDAAEIWLVEASPSLRRQQGEKLAAHSVHWVDQVSDLPKLPMFLIANEFFDALPVRQYVRAKEGWQEQMIGLDAGKLVFGLAAPMPIDALEDNLSSTKPGDIVETCSPAQGKMHEIALRLAGYGGVAIIIDYGELGSSGDTFQAVRHHQKTDPLTDPGLSDLTAHVDFAALVRAADGIAATGLTAQGVLLERLGIAARAQALAAGLAGEQLENHIAAHHRLTHPSEMGSLFKAIAFHPPDTHPPPGFD